MISVITAVHNQLPMNRLFVRSLQETTRLPYELVVVDNHSTDGTREYFETAADQLVANTVNHNYSYSQNQGIERAQYDYLAFFNNDMLLSPGWDEKIIALMEEKGLDIVSFATNDHLENKAIRSKINRRYKRIKYPLLRLGKLNERNLLRMVKWTYGDFERFCQKRFEQFGSQTIEAYSGSCILMHRRALEKVGMWDARIQAGDWDLYNRIKLRQERVGDIVPIQLALGIYFHHFRRLTVKGNPEPFVDADQMISLEEKWGAETQRFRKDIEGLG